MQTDEVDLEVQLHGGSDCCEGRTRTEGNPGPWVGCSLKGKLGLVRTYRCCKVGVSDHCSKPWRPTGWSWDVRPACVVAILLAGPFLEPCWRCQSAPHASQNP